MGFLIDFPELGGMATNILSPSDQTFSISLLSSGLYIVCYSKVLWDRFPGVFEFPFMKHDVFAFLIC